MKRIISISLLLTACIGMLIGCGPKEFDPKTAVTVVSREEGSGTRSAFVELLGIEARGADGTKKDLTSKEAIIAKQTDVMMTTVARNKHAIGYISLGSLNDTIKAIAIDGVPANSENVKNGSYAIARPFFVATKGNPSGLAEDFIKFILSDKGQAIVSNNYIAVSNNPAAYSGTDLKGKLVVTGSSSVTPVMEKLKEAYVKLNTGVVIEVHQSDSSAGMNAALSGTCDIGMASRDLRETELKELRPVRIAMDGIAVIVNRENTIAGLTKNQVKDVFIEGAVWNDLLK
ncbi:MAG: substrate-binding domain-containing protein [Leptospirales bacterium]|nr:substrate-binding domain-containing protein [Leptospirales bacterium]